MGSLKLTVILTTRSIEMTTTNTDASRTTSVENSRTSENKCTFTPEKKDKEEDCRESFSIAIDTSRSSIVDNFVSMAHQEANFVPGRWERKFSTDDQQGYGDHGTVTSFLC